MAIVWLTIEVLFLCLFFSLPTLTELPDETTPLVTEKPAIAINSPRPHGHGQAVSLSWAMRFQHLVKEEIVVLLAVLFVVMFNQTGVEVYSVLYIRRRLLMLCIIIDNVCPHGPQFIELE